MSSRGIFLGDNAEEAAVFRAAEAGQENALRVNHSVINGHWSTDLRVDGFV